MLSFVSEANCDRCLGNMCRRTASHVSIITTVHRNNYIVRLIPLPLFVDSHPLHAVRAGVSLRLRVLFFVFPERINTI